MTYTIVPDRKYTNIILVYPYTFVYMAHIYHYPFLFYKYGKYNMYSIEIMLDMLVTMTYRIAFSNIYGV
jgi:hypothetical protein